MMLWPFLSSRILCTDYCISERQFQIHTSFANDKHPRALLASAPLSSCAHDSLWGWYDSHVSHEDFDLRNARILSSLIFNAV